MNKSLSLFEQSLVKDLYVSNDVDASVPFYDENNMAICPLRVFSWEKLRVLFGNVSQLSIPSICPIDIDSLPKIQAKGILKTIIIRSHINHHISFDDFCSFFSHKLIVGINAKVDRGHDLKPITKIVLDSDVRTPPKGKRIVASHYTKPTEFSFMGGDIISRELGEKIREYEKNKQENATEVVVGQEVVQTAEDYIRQMVKNG